LLGYDIKPKIKILSLIFFARLERKQREVHSVFGEGGIKEEGTHDSPLPLLSHARQN
jgi:hypothetical protein